MCGFSMGRTALLALLMIRGTLTQSTPCVTTVVTANREQHICDTPDSAIAQFTASNNKAITIIDNRHFYFPFEWEFDSDIAEQFSAEINIACSDLNRLNCVTPPQAGEVVSAFKHTVSKMLSILTHYNQYVFYYYIGDDNSGQIESQISSLEELQSAVARLISKSDRSFKCKALGGLNEEIRGLNSEIQFFSSNYDTPVSYINEFDTKGCIETSTVSGISTVSIITTLCPVEYPTTTIGSNMFQPTACVTTQANHGTTCIPDDEAFHTWYGANHEIISVLDKVDDLSDSFEFDPAYDHTSLGTSLANSVDSARTKLKSLGCLMPSQASNLFSGFIQTTTKFTNTLKTLKRNARFSPDIATLAENIDVDGVKALNFYIDSFSSLLQKFPGNYPCSEIIATNNGITLLNDALSSLNFELGIHGIPVPEIHVTNCRNPTTIVTALCPTTASTHMGSTTKFLTDANIGASKFPSSTGTSLSITSGSPAMASQPIMSTSNTDGHTPFSSQVNNNRNSGSLSRPQMRTNSNSGVFSDSCVSAEGPTAGVNTNSNGNDRRPTGHILRTHRNGAYSTGSTVNTNRSPTGSGMYSWSSPTSSGVNTYSNGRYSSGSRAKFPASYGVVIRDNRSSTSSDVKKYRSSTIFVNNNNSSGSPINFGSDKSRSISSRPTNIDVDTKIHGSSIAFSANTNINSGSFTGPTINAKNNSGHSTALDPSANRFSIGSSNITKSNSWSTGSSPSASKYSMDSSIITKSRRDISPSRGALTVSGMKTKSNSDTGGYSTGSSTKSLDSLLSSGVKTNGSPTGSSTLINRNGNSSIINENPSRSSVNANGGFPTNSVADTRKNGRSSTVLVVPTIRNPLTASAVHTNGTVTSLRVKTKSIGDSFKMSRHSTGSSAKMNLYPTKYDMNTKHSSGSPQDPDVHTISNSGLPIDSGKTTYKDSRSLSSTLTTNISGEFSRGSIMSTNSHSYSTGSGANTKRIDMTSTGSSVMKRPKHTAASFKSYALPYSSSTATKSNGTSTGTSMNTKSNSRSLTDFDERTSRPSTSSRTITKSISKNFAGSDMSTSGSSMSTKSKGSSHEIIGSTKSYISPTGFTVSTSTSSTHNIKSVVSPTSFTWSIKSRKLLVGSGMSYNSIHASATSSRISSDGPNTSSSGCYKSISLPTGSEVKFKSYIQPAASSIITLSYSSPTASCIGTKSNRSYPTGGNINRSSLGTSFIKKINEGSSTSSGMSINSNDEGSLTGPSTIIDRNSKLPSRSYESTKSKGSAHTGYGMNTNEYNVQNSRISDSSGGSSGITRTSPTGSGENPKTNFATPTGSDFSANSNGFLTDSSLDTSSNGRFPSGSSVARISSGNNALPTSSGLNTYRSPVTAFSTVTNTDVASITWMGVNSNSNSASTTATSDIFTNSRLVLSSGQDSVGKSSLFYPNITAVRSDVSQHSPSASAQKMENPSRALLTVTTSLASSLTGSFSDTNDGAPHTGSRVNTNKNSGSSLNGLGVSTNDNIVPPASANINTNGSPTSSLNTNSNSGSYTSSVIAKSISKSVPDSSVNTKSKGGYSTRKRATINESPTGSSVISKSDSYAGGNSNSNSNGVYPTGAGVKTSSTSITPAISREIIVSTRDIATSQTNSGISEGSTKAFITSSYGITTRSSGKNTNDNEGISTNKLIVNGGSSIVTPDPLRSDSASIKPNMKSDSKVAGKANTTFKTALISGINITPTGSVTETGSVTTSNGTISDTTKSDSYGSERTSSLGRNSIRSKGSANDVAKNSETSPTVVATNPSTSEFSSHDLFMVTKNSEKLTPTVHVSGINDSSSATSSVSISVANTACNLEPVVLLAGLSFAAIIM